MLSKSKIETMYRHYRAIGVSPSAIPVQKQPPPPPGGSDGPVKGKGEEKVLYLTHCCPPLPPQLVR